MVIVAVLTFVLSCLKMAEKDQTISYKEEYSVERDREGSHGNELDSQSVGWLPGFLPKAANREKSY